MRSLTLSRRRVLAAALLLAAAFAVAGRHLLRAEPASPAPAPPAAVQTSVPPPLLVVDVVGAVLRPGLYRLPPGTRVADALARAGGATARADLELVNLAAPLLDGQEILVPRKGEGGGPVGGAAPTGPVHLNSATVEQLDALPGIGPVTAQKIVAYRAAHGAFTSVDELDAIPGIGPARIDQLRDLVAP